MPLWCSFGTSSRPLLIVEEDSFMRKVSSQVAKSFKKTIALAD